MNPLDKDKLPKIHTDKRQQSPIFQNAARLKSRRNTIAAKVINDGENTLQDLSQEMRQVSLACDASRYRSSTSSNSTTTRSSMECSLPPINPATRMSFDEQDSKKWLKNDKQSVRERRRTSLFMYPENKDLKLGRKETL